jgi:acyl carrier protein
MRRAWTIEEATETVRAMWTDILSREDIDAESDFFVLGGDSLAATVLMVYVEETFGVALDPAEIFENPSLAAIASTIIRHANVGAAGFVEEEAL